MDKEGSEQDKELDLERLEKLSEQINSPDHAQAIKAAEAYAELVDETDFLANGDQEAVRMVQNALIGKAEFAKLLRDRVVPFVRELGFKGTYPHFRRVRPNQIDTLMFQFNRSDPSFVIELGACPPGGRQYKNGTIVPPEKVTTAHLEERFRIGSGYREGKWHDHWIFFAPLPPMDDALAAFLKPDYHLEATSSGAIKEALDLLQTVAEAWWQSRKLQ